MTNLGREFLKKFGVTPPTAQKFMRFLEWKIGQVLRRIIV